MSGRWIRRARVAWLAGLVAFAAVFVCNPPTHAADGPSIETWTLPNGARVMYAYNPALPMLDVGVEFPAGWSRDTRATSGTANLAIGLMRLGAGGMGETDVARALSDVGAQLAPRFDADRGGWTLRTLSSPRERDAALDVLARIVQRPEYPAAVVEREKARLVAGLREADTKPETVAERAFAAAMYARHPYGLRAAGEIDTVEQLSATDLAGFHRTWFRSDWAVVSIMGDADRSRADAIARALTDGLPRADGPVPPLPRSARTAGAEQIRVPHPASQSHVLMGMPGVARDDPDWFALLVANHVLGGGGFASRLVEEIRVKRGLAYSAYSVFAPQRYAGVFQAGLQTRRDQADQAVAVMRDTIARYRDSGPSDAELDAAKQNLINGFPLRIDSNRKIHDYLGIIGFYGLPLDYLAQFTRHIDAVTRDDVRRVLAARLDPQQWVTVVVGVDPAKP
ncbi:MAG: insulinase family protein [Burkholderiales bacterium]|jgi:zinc protease|nr:insulinase family protein [Burkholderiales bacterium]